MITTAAQLGAARVELGYSVPEAAERFGVTERSWRRFERGSHRSGGKDPPERICTAVEIELARRDYAEDESR